MADKRISQLVERTDIANNDVVPIVASGATTTNKATISSIQEFMQENLDLGVTSVGITLGSSGTDVSVTGSPITTSGNITINLPTASATNRGLLSSADWTTFNNKQASGNYVTLDTDQTITGAKTFSQDIFVNGRKIGRGSGNITSNTVVGNSALRDNTTGSENSAFGGNSLRQITTGSANTAIGFGSMINSETGSGNTAIGNSTLSGNNGSNNIAVGNSAGRYIAGGTVVNETCLNSVYLGANTRPSLDGNTNEIVIGQNAIGQGSNTVTIGNSSTTLNKLFGRLIHADAVNADESATLGQVNTSLAGYVTLNTAQNITAPKGFINSGGGTCVTLNHTSGSGVALDIIKNGNNEAIRVTKTSGSGNAITVVGANIEVLGNFVKTGGTSTQYLMADGSTSTLTNPVTGTGANGQVAFWNGTNSQTGDNGLFWDNTNKRLGVGTSTPLGKLQITNTNNGNVTTGLYLKNSTGINGGIAIDFDNTGSDNIQARINSLRTNDSNFSTALVFSVNTSSGMLTESIRISTSGNLLVGTTTDAGFRLDVNGTARVQGAATFSSSLTANGSLSGFQGATHNLLIDWSSESQITTLTNTDLFFGTNAQRRMTIKAGGNVGIGTDSPSATDWNASATLLHIYQNSTNGSVLKLESSNASGIVAVGNNAMALGTTTDDALTLVTNATERVRIQNLASGGFLKATNNGSLFVSLSSPYHEFNNSVNSNNTIFNSDAETLNTDGIVRIDAARTTTDNSFYVLTYYNSGVGLYRFRVADSGNVTNTNNSYGALSDIKLKENITDASPKLDDLLKVKVRNYNLIGEETKQIGVIAQELEEVFPSMIDESQDFEDVDVPQLDEEGNEVLNEEGEIVSTKERVSKGTTTKSVKYSVFVPMLIKAIQEQQEIINEMRAEIDSLKNQIK
jgi:hypothetical protein